MKTLILLCLFPVCSTFCQAQVQINKDTLERDYFADVKAEPLGLYLKFKANGSRYALNPNRISNYGEEILLNFGDSLHLQGKQSYLQLSPLPQPFTKFGFFVETQFDARGFGGIITKKEAIILIIPSIKNTGIKSDVLELRFIEPDLKKAKTMLNL